MHQYNINLIFQGKEKTAINSWLKKHLDDINAEKNKKDAKQLCSLTDKIYNQGLSALDIINYYEQYTKNHENVKYKFILYFNKVKEGYRNEKLLILNILYFIFLRSEFDLENILNI